MALHNSVNLILFVVLQIFLVTGGHDSDTTEILEDKKWKVLKSGNLPIAVNSGLRLATIDNNVFSFGKIALDFNFIL